MKKTPLDPHCQAFQNAIDLSEELASVEKKVKAMFTDPNRKKRSDPGDPQICNVFAFHGMLNTKERHAKMSQRMDERQKAHEACTGKRGDALQQCYREQREKSGHHKHGQKG